MRGGEEGREEDGCGGGSGLAREGWGEVQSDQWRDGRVTDLDERGVVVRWKIC